jgi:hypothetical protein
VVDVDSAWLCVVLNKNLCTKGVDVAQKEMSRLAGDSFIDFKMVDDGFDNDCYSFIKCDVDIDIEGFRKSANVVTVLDSYDNPTFLADDEVMAFANVDKEIIGTKYGDTVIVEGEGHYSGLHGVVIKEGDTESEVMFRFHTVTKRIRLSNEELFLTGNIFNKMKIPLTNVKLSEGQNGKFPVVERRNKGVDKSEFDRTAD